MTIKPTDAEVAALAAMTIITAIINAMRRLAKRIRQIEPFSKNLREFRLTRAALSYRPSTGFYSSA
jgi:hypothetical protein